jgi:DNA-directed RNA polymerase subunit RPC12/RpoP
MNQKTSNNRTMLFCEPCGYKRIIESEADVADLTENKTSPVQLHIPILDETSLKMKPSKFQEQAKRYKCPQCGRTVKTRELLKPFNDALKQVDEQKAKQALEADKQKRIDDGKPHEKKIDPEFMG